ncbi:unnamed protein product [Vitrella brassicaformis CCMP3155]|uniref:Uncharacterized protein n=6 Tax=Vitrella brassicaformis TaxID=1169539 RepID=A0A0G4H3U8_VITBC|nr:unnamed protein product [Vitrella brassicaformis CCMP3155]|eukprot:CEM38379.1 unnamed protein product [Vitrella brassicaformis CCMP3155]
MRRGRKMNKKSLLELFATHGCEYKPGDNGDAIGLDGGASACFHLTVSSKTLKDRLTAALTSTTSNSTDAPTLVSAVKRHILAPNPQDNDTDTDLQTAFLLPFSVEDAVLDAVHVDGESGRGRGAVGVMRAENVFADYGSASLCRLLLSIDTGGLQRLLAKALIDLLNEKVVDGMVDDAMWLPSTLSQGMPLGMGIGGRGSDANIPQLILKQFRYMEGRVEGLVEGLLDVFELADNMPKAKREVLRLLPSLTTREEDRSTMLKRLQAYLENDTSNGGNLQEIDDDDDLDGDDMGRNTARARKAADDKVVSADVLECLSCMHLDAQTRETITDIALGLLPYLPDTEWPTLIRFLASHTPPPFYDDLYAALKKNLDIAGIFKHANQPPLGRKNNGGGNRGRERDEEGDELMGVDEVGAGGGAGGAGAVVVEVPGCKWITKTFDVLRSTLQVNAPLARFFAKKVAKIAGARVADNNNDDDDFPPLSPKSSHSAGGGPQPHSFAEFELLLLTILMETKADVGGGGKRAFGGGGNGGNGGNGGCPTAHEVLLTALRNEKVKLLKVLEFVRSAPVPVVRLLSGGMTQLLVVTTKHVAMQNHSGGCGAFPSSSSKTQHPHAFTPHGIRQLLNIYLSVFDAFDKSQRKQLIKMLLAHVTSPTHSNATSASSAAASTAASAKPDKTPAKATALGKRGGGLALPLADLGCADTVASNSPGSLLACRLLVGLCVRRSHEIDIFAQALTKAVEGTSEAALMEMLLVGVRCLTPVNTLQIWVQKLSSLNRMQTSKYTGILAYMAILRDLGEYEVSFREEEGGFPVEEATLKLLKAVEKDPRQQAFAYECLAAGLDAGYVPPAVGEIVKNDAMAVMDQSTLSKTHHKQKGQSGGRRSAMNEAAMECAWPDMVADLYVRVLSRDVYSSPEAVVQARDEGAEEVARLLPSHAITIVTRAARNRSMVSLPSALRVCVSAILANERATEHMEPVGLAHPSQAFKQDTIVPFKELDTYLRAPLLVPTWVSSGVAEDDMDDEDEGETETEGRQVVGPRVFLTHKSPWQWGEYHHSQPSNKKDLICKCYFMAACWAREVLNTLASAYDHFLNQRAVFRAKNKARQRRSGARSGGAGVFSPMRGMMEEDPTVEVKMLHRLMQQYEMCVGIEESLELAVRLHPAFKLPSSELPPNAQDITDIMQGGRESFRSAAGGAGGGGAAAKPKAAAKNGGKGGGKTEKEHQIKTAEHVLRQLPPVSPKVLHLLRVLTLRPNEDVDMDVPMPELSPPTLIRLVALLRHTMRLTFYAQPFLCVDVGAKEAATAKDSKKKDDDEAFDQAHTHRAVYRFVPSSRARGGGGLVATLGGVGSREHEASVVGEGGIGLVEVSLMLLRKVLGERVNELHQFKDTQLADRNENEQAKVCELCEELESILLAFGDFIYFLPTLIHIKPSGVRCASSVLAAASTAIQDTQQQQQQQQQPGEDDMECDGDNDGEGGGGDGDNSPGTLRKFIEEREGRLVEERRRFGQPSSSKGNDYMLHNIWRKGPGDDAQDRGDDMYDDNDDGQDDMHLEFAPPMPPYPNQHHHHHNNNNAGFDDIPLLAKEERRISEAYADGGAWRGLKQAMAAYGRSLKALVTMEGFPSLSVTMLAQDYLVQLLKVHALISARLRRHSHNNNAAKKDGEAIKTTLHEVTDQLLCRAWSQLDVKYRPALMFEALKVSLEHGKTTAANMIKRFANSALPQIRQHYRRKVKNDTEGGDKKKKKKKKDKDNDEEAEDFPAPKDFECLDKQNFAAFYKVMLEQVNSVLRAEVVQPLSEYIKKKSALKELIKKAAKEESLADEETKKNTPLGRVKAAIHRTCALVDSWKALIEFTKYDPSSTLLRHAMTVGRRTMESLTKILGLVPALLLAEDFRDDIKDILTTIRRVLNHFGKIRVEVKERKLTALDKYLAPLARDHEALLSKLQHEFREDQDTNKLNKKGAALELRAPAMRNMQNQKIDGVLYDLDQEDDDNDNNDDEQEAEDGQNEDDDRPKQKHKQHKKNKKKRPRQPGEHEEGEEGEEGEGGEDDQQPDDNDEEPRKRKKKQKKKKDKHPQQEEDQEGEGEGEGGEAADEEEQQDHRHKKKDRDKNKNKKNKPAPAPVIVKREHDGDADGEGDGHDDDDTPPAPQPPKKQKKQQQQQQQEAAAKAKPKLRPQGLQRDTGRQLHESIAQR